MQHASKIKILISLYCVWRPSNMAVPNLTQEIKTQSTDTRGISTSLNMMTRSTGGKEGDYSRTTRWYRRLCAPNSPVMVPGGCYKQWGQWHHTFSCRVSGKCNRLHRHDDQVLDWDAGHMYIPAWLCSISSKMAFDNFLYHVSSTMLPFSTPDLYRRLRLSGVIPQYQKVVESWCRKCAD